ncbi:hypothetical protein ACQP1O_28960 [Nocardia sp. CA-151230]|uniref:hypothetical protein n=1 Tax=Nocardia sp. CA-151230 TaxID=3239982 RepID=UPI003D930688
MTFVYNLVVVIHLLCMAAVIGGYALARPKVSEWMLWGARALVVTGLVMVLMAHFIHSLDKHLLMPKIVVKLALGVAVAGLAELGHYAKRDKVISWSANGAGSLAIANVCVAVLWH